MATVNDDSEPRRKKPAAIRPLDMFLLGLVRGGLITPYDWQSRARTSLGASLPAVERLLAAGLMKKARKGPRGRHEYALTDKGRDAVAVPGLRSYLKDALDKPLDDLESVLRLACLATTIGDNETAKKFLLEATQSHRQRARNVKKRTSEAPFKSRLGGLYSMLLTHREIGQEAATVKQLEALHRRWDVITDAILEAGDKRKTDR